jgi:hypothetical protein
MPKLTVDDVEIEVPAGAGGSRAGGGAMRFAVGFLFVELALAGTAPDAALARNKMPPAQIDQIAACAVEKNAGDVAWMYMVQSEQSGLNGPAFYGAAAHAVGFMTRDCAPEGTAFDNDLIAAVSNKAFALWGGDPGRASQPRAIDAWADCVAERYGANARAYVFARDMAFAGGPNLIVEGVDPVQSIVDATPDCAARKPATGVVPTDLDLFARLNYLVRVKPRITPATPALTGEGG